MNRRYIDEDDDIDEIPRDREISLGATTILGMFFLLALVCAVFFGVGYNMGRKSSATAMTPSAGDSVEASTIQPTGAAKPTAGMTNVPQPAASEETPTEPAATQIPQPEAKPAEKTRVVAEIRPTEKPAAVKVPVVREAPAPAPVAVVAPSASDVPSIVQVAAVSHQEDAEMLVNALKRRGYKVGVRHEPQDKLLHVQIGPLASRKEADAMKQRLLSDGYKAIVK